MHFHGAYFSNYLAWLKDPVGARAVCCTAWPLLGQGLLNPGTGSASQGLDTPAALMPLWRSLGYARPAQLKAASSFFLLASLLAVCGSSFHMHCSCAWLSRKNRSAAARVVLLGLRAVSWAGHAGAVGAPASAALDSGFDLTGIRGPGARGQAHAAPFSNLAAAALNPETGAAFAGQVAAHHAYVGFYAIARAVLSCSCAGRGARRLEPRQACGEGGVACGLESCGLQAGPAKALSLHPAHAGAFSSSRPSSRRPSSRRPLRSAHRSLAAALGSLALASALYAWLSSAAPPHPLLAPQYASMLSLFCHHLWVAGFLLAGAAAHACIDCVLGRGAGSVLGRPAGSVLGRGQRSLKISSAQPSARAAQPRALQAPAQQAPAPHHAPHHRDLILGHLAWASASLGMHSFGLYLHNDGLQALGRPEDSFSDAGSQLKPVAAAVLQTPMLSFHAKVLEKKLLCTSPGSGTADFLVHHVHALSLHVTSLVLLKASLYARSSRLLPAKASLGFRYACDGPGRGGTCQVSPWDHLYLAVFWVYNALSVVGFHFFWKMESDVWGSWSGPGGAAGGEASASPPRHTSSRDFSLNPHVNAWLRGFLWSQSAQAMQSYASSLSGYGFLFVSAHFAWALSLMFLFSGRGYWQELIESLLWAHLKLKLVPEIQPRALSISQGRAAGLSHYTLGGAGCSWSFFLCRLLGG